MWRQCAEYGNVYEYKSELLNVSRFKLKYFLLASIFRVSQKKP